MWSHKLLKVGLAINIFFAAIIIIVSLIINAVFNNFDNGNSKLLSTIVWSCVGIGSFILLLSIITIFHLRNAEEGSTILNGALILTIGILSSCLGSIGGWLILAGYIGTPSHLKEIISPIFRQSSRSHRNDWYDQKDDYYKKSMPESEFRRN